MKLKVLLSGAVGLLSFVAGLGLPAPWGPLASALLATVAYLTNHDAVAAKFAGSK